MKHQDIIIMMDIGLTTNCIILCHHRECHSLKIMGLIIVHKFFQLSITIRIINFCS